MAITWRTPGAALVSAASATSIAPAYPAGCVEGDKLLLVVGQRPSTVNSGSVSTPSGWNLVASKLASGGYGTTFAADTANTNIYVFERTVPAGGLSGNLTVSVSTNNVCWAQILRLTTSNGSWGSVAGATGEDVTGGTAVSIACASNPGVTAGDAILTAMCIPTDAHTGFSGYGATQAGVTFGTWTQRAYVDSGTGNDIGGFVATSAVSAGTATGVPTITATAAGTTTNVRGPGAFVRIREGAKAATGSGSVSASAAVAATGKKGAAGTGSVAAAATVTALGTAAFASEDKTGSASVAAAAAVSASGAKRASGAATVSVSAAVQALGAKRAAGVAGISATSAVIASGAKRAISSPSVPAAATINVVGTKRALGAGSILAAAQVVAIGEAWFETYDKTGSAAVSAVASVDARGLKRASGSADILALASVEARAFMEGEAAQSRGGVGRIVYAKRKSQRDDEVILAVINKFLEVVQ